MTLTMLLSLIRDWCSVDTKNERRYARISATIKVLSADTERFWYGYKQHQNRDLNSQGDILRVRIYTRRSLPC